jgi:hypothetical protein
MNNMGKMSYIHHLCETDNKKGLIEELGSTRMAEGFLEAHKEMRDKANTVAFGKLNELVDDSLDEYTSQCCSAKIIYHDICSSCREHI